MSVAGHHLPIWFDEATGPDDGDVSVWNSATGRFESVPAVGGAIPDGTYGELASSTTDQGFHRNTDTPVHGGPWYTFGNAANSIGFAGSGSPAEGFGALVVYQRYGYSTPNSPIPKTTQGMYVLTSYFGPTSDDSAEGFSSFVGLSDTGTPFAQTKPVTGIEGIAQVMGGNTALTGNSAPVVAVGGRVETVGTSHVASSASFKASQNTGAGPFGTTDQHIAFWQPVTANATVKYGVYVIDSINSEASLNIARSAGAAFAAKWGGGTDGSVSLANIGQPVTSYGTLSGAYTLTTTPQTLTATAGATLPAGGGSFMLNTTARTVVTYTSFAGTTISGAAIASGSVATATGVVMLDATAPNTTALRVNGQWGQSRNILEVWDAGATNLRVRVNSAGNLITQGTSFFAANGSALSLAEMNGAQGYVRPGTTAGMGARIFSGSGAPNISTSVAGDFYLRTDTPGTTNQRLYVATGANTWTGIL